MILRCSERRATSTSNLIVHKSWKSGLCSTYSLLGLASDKRFLAPCMHVEEIVRSNEVLAAPSIGTFMQKRNEAD